MTTCLIKSAPLCFKMLAQSVHQTSSWPMQARYVERGCRLSTDTQTLLHDGRGAWFKHSSCRRLYLYEIGRHILATVCVIVGQGGRESGHSQASHDSLQGAGGSQHSEAVSQHLQHTHAAHPQKSCHHVQRPPLGLGRGHVSLLLHNGSRQSYAKVGNQPDYAVQELRQMGKRR